MTAWPTSRRTRTDPIVAFVVAGEAGLVKCGLLRGGRGAAGSLVARVGESGEVRLAVLGGQAIGIFVVEPRRLTVRLFGGAFVNVHPGTLTLPHARADGVAFRERDMQKAGSDTNPRV